MEPSEDKPKSRNRRPRSKGLEARPSAGEGPSATATAASAADLLEEIACLRSIMRRAAELADKESLSDEDLALLQVVDSFGRASTRLANLLKTQRELGAGDDAAAALNQALAEAIKELGQ
jgi:hypothetical protein